MLYSWDNISHTWMNKQNGIIIFGDLLELQPESAEAKCTCVHYTDKRAFDAITSSANGLELWASKAKFKGDGEMIDCGFGQGLYCVGKPTEYFLRKEDLIVNNFANEPMNFSDEASAAVCASTSLEQKCDSDKMFKKKCKRTCLMARRQGKVDYGIVISAPCPIVYNVSEKATKEMTAGPGKTRKGEAMVPGRDVTVVRLEQGGEVINVKDAGLALLDAIEHDDFSRVTDLLTGNPVFFLAAKDERGITPVSLAAKKGHSETVKALAALKADPESKDRHQGQTPISLAACAGHSDSSQIAVSNPGGAVTATVE